MKDRVDFQSGKKMRRMHRSWKQWQNIGLGITSALAAIGAFAFFSPEPRASDFSRNGLIQRVLERMYPLSEGQTDSNFKNNRDAWVSTTARKITFERQGTQTTSATCLYNASLDQVEVDLKVVESSEDLLVRCLAPAIAQLRYEQIEPRWLNHLELRQGWVMRGGKLVLVEFSNRGSKNNGISLITDSSARALWVILASREMERAANLDGDLKNLDELGYARAPQRSLASIEKKRVTGFSISAPRVQWTEDSSVNQLLVSDVD